MNSNFIEELFPWLLPALEEKDPDSVLDNPFNWRRDIHTVKIQKENNTSKFVKIKKGDLICQTQMKSIGNHSTNNRRNCY